MPTKRQASTTASNGADKFVTRTEPSAGSATPPMTIVGIGASAGGLDACRKLLMALSPNNGLTFILIQHLDPDHDSMMVDLLAAHTQLTVCEAVDGMPIQANFLYANPPDAYVSVTNGILRVASPTAHRGVRLPVDFLFHSLARETGSSAACVILSGTGSDGSKGVLDIKKNGGFVLVQEPNEAAYDGMPTSAIATGAVDMVLPVAEIPAALLAHHRGDHPASTEATHLATQQKKSGMREVIDMLRTHTAHDFSDYKPGTLQRRIERRMVISGVEAGRMDLYRDIVADNVNERELLAQDLLINVTNFFRDSKVFDLLADTILPDLIVKHPIDRPLRLWVAGCSTGEEAYSLAILLREQIVSAKREIRLQIFASDIDTDAVVSARDGIYSAAIESTVSPERLARFFVKEDSFYRVNTDLRALVIFTVQNILMDPPFSRLDFVSCRNLLIYLQPDAQAKVISLFHFALRPGGTLLLGNAETVRSDSDGFEVVSRAGRVYRKIDRAGHGDFMLRPGASESTRFPRRAGAATGPSRQTALADMCRRLVMESYAPAALLINERQDILYSIGPTERYLRMAPGFPTYDLLAMARPQLRARLNAAIKQARTTQKRVIVSGGASEQDSQSTPFNIDVRPVGGEDPHLLLLCFVDDPLHAARIDQPIPAADLPRVEILEHELDTTRTELRVALRNLDLSTEEQNAINEEALSVNEEHQSTNEELLASKEELQSLNEELTALNSQLQETLERQRTTSNDLQNVLYSTDVATLFLDKTLNIRFFTPATKAVFNVIPGDIGRPLSDLQSLASDAELPTDALNVMRTGTPVEREIETRNASWFIRRILPYRAQDDSVEGVVITFTNITERKLTARALEQAKGQADLANHAKSRFLAAASHDLRQPLQTLSLLQGLLAKTVDDAKSQTLVARLDDTVGTISGMLNTLLDINQIEAGSLRAEKVIFPINDILERLHREFVYHAREHDLELRIVPCSLMIYSDPRLLEQMIRNLLSNAFKYTRTGRILMGCRRSAGLLDIEIWDTGVGIAEADLQAIFQEYHQLGDASRSSSRGLGLGLSIVERLGNFLDHKVSVRSWRGKGSVFSILVAVSGATVPKNTASDPRQITHVDTPAASIKISIFVIEDNPEVRELLEMLLLEEGHQTSTASDGKIALDSIRSGAMIPDIILADFNLPKDWDGLETVARIRRLLQRHIPAIILTGDISTQTQRNIERQGCVRLNKPVKLHELTRVIESLVGTSPENAPPPAHMIPTSAKDTQHTIFIIDDDADLLAAMRATFEHDGQVVKAFGNSESFLEVYKPGESGCLVVDAILPGMSGIALLRRLAQDACPIPSIVITGDGDVAMAVQAMQAGATDFIEKPTGSRDLLASVARAVAQSTDRQAQISWRASAMEKLETLTMRQLEIMHMIVAGQPNKNIAIDLGISQRTVENHRAAIMVKTGAKSLPALARLALAASGNQGISDV